MERNVLKELPLLANPTGLDLIENAAKHVPGVPRIKPRQSLLESFDPLYSCLLENEVKTSVLEQPEPKSFNPPATCPMMLIDISEETVETCKKLDETITVTHNENDNLACLVQEQSPPEIQNSKYDDPISDTEIPQEQSDSKLNEDEPRKLDETIYFSPLKNVIEFKHSHSGEDTPINVEQVIEQGEICKEQLELKQNEHEPRKLDETIVKQDVLQSTIIEKVEMKDVCTQCDVNEQEIEVAQQVTISPNVEEYLHLLGQYEAQMNAEMSGATKLKEEHATMQKHLTTLELAFSDVHQKYERSKIVLEGYRVNEEMLRQRFVEAEQTILNYEQKKNETKKQMVDYVNSCNMQITSERNKYQREISKLIASNKLLEIKVKSVEKALVQKTTECNDLMRLLDEVTGK